MPTSCNELHITVCDVALHNLLHCHPAATLVTSTAANFATVLAGKY